MPRSFAADVIVIASPADPVAGRLKSELEKRGCEVLQLDGMPAARLFTIRTAQGSSSLTPVVPMFIRQSAWQPIHAESDADQRFLQAEAYATVWAAAALSKKPVINRPAPDGYIGRLTGGAISASTARSAPAKEFHASSPQMLDDPDNTLWGEDVSFNTAPVALLRADVPLRARRIDTDALYEIVTVVGDRALPATLDSRTIDLNLCAQSLDIAKAVGVHFATITWSIHDRHAAPTRLNAAPDEAELRYNWNEVAEALCRDLHT
jgi:hypothetical protein